MYKCRSLFSAFALALIVNNAWLVAAADQTNGGWTTTLVDGLKLTYPQSFQKTAIGPSSDNKDNLLKLSGLVGSSYLELAVSKLDLPQEMSLETSIKSLDEIVFSKLPGFRSNGLLRSISPYKRAVEREITFKHGDTEYFQKQAFLKNGDTKLLTLTGPIKSQASAGSVWQAALSSLTSSSTGARPAGPQQNHPAAGGQNKMNSQSNANTWTSKDGRLSLAFPARLIEKVMDSDDHCLKAVYEEAGKVIGLDIYRGKGDNELGLSQISEILEEKHFATLNDYRKIKEEPKQLGDSGSLPSIVRESTFETNGCKVHHLSAYIKDEKQAKVYAICLTTAGLNHNEANQVWNSIVSSVRLKN
ncbi:MAG: hypothetical protein K2Y32_01505 [Candidatus Obscuribacterales bacterium]|nr:hypothetical protein [Candidatus Obscuribacterales bacterium]